MTLMNGIALDPIIGIKITKEDKMKSAKEILNRNSKDRCKKGLKICLKFQRLLSLLQVLVAVHVQIMLNCGMKQKN